MYGASARSSEGGFNWMFRGLTSSVMSVGRNNVLLFSVWFKVSQGRRQSLILIGLSASNWPLH